MNNIQAGDLAVVVQGIWPNIGRLVFVSRFVSDYDFSAMCLGVRDGWRVRSWGQYPLETTGGPRMAGFTPVGSLRRLDPLPAVQRREIELEMAHADFKEAMANLAKILENSDELAEACAV